MGVYILPVIKKITVQKNNKERYNIFFDDGISGQYAFSVSEDILIKHDLRKGKDVSEEELTDIFYHEEIQKAYNQAIQFLSFRMRSMKEVHDYLSDKGIDEGVIEEVIRRLRERKYINDEEFTALYVKTQLNTTDKGPIILKEALRKKGITDIMIEEIVDKHYLPEIQLEKAISLCHKHKRKGKTLSSIQLKNNLQQMLVRKGYTKEIISKAMEATFIHNEENNEEDAIRFQGEKAWRKYQSQPVDKRIIKVKQYLYRRGFQLSDIERFLEDSITSEE